MRDTWGGVCVWITVWPRTTFRVQSVRVGCNKIKELNGAWLQTCRGCNNCHDRCISYGASQATMDCLSARSGSLVRHVGTALLTRHRFRLRMLLSRSCCRLLHPVTPWNLLRRICACIRPCTCACPLSGSPYTPGLFIFLREMVHVYTCCPCQLVPAAEQHVARGWVPSVHTRAGALCSASNDSACRTLWRYGSRMWH